MVLRARRSRLVRLASRRCRVWLSALCREDRLDELRYEDLVLVDEDLEGHARRLVRRRGNRLAVLVAERGRSAEHERHRAVELGELDDLGLLRGDLEDHDLVLLIECLPGLTGWCAG